MKAQSKRQTRRELRQLRHRAREWDRTVSAFCELVEHYKRRANRAEHETRVQAEKIRQLTGDIGDMCAGRLQNCVVGPDDGYRLVLPVRFG